MLTASTSRGTVETVPYRENPLVHYRCLADLPDPVLLDSGADHGLDLVAAAPLANRSLRLPAAPDAAAVAGFFAALETLHADRPAVDDARTRLPFAGGLVGEPVLARPGMGRHDDPKALFTRPVRRRRNDTAARIRRPRHTESAPRRT